MCAFLSMARYVRQWILGYATIIEPLQDVTKLNTPEQLSWTEKTDHAFVKLKQALFSAPALGLLNYSFILYCHEKGGFVQAVLSQKHGDQHQPIACFSACHLCCASMFESRRSSCYSSRIIILTCTKLYSDSSSLSYSRCYAAQNRDTAPICHTPCCTILY